MGKRTDDRVHFENVPEQRNVKIYILCVWYLIHNSLLHPLFECGGYKVNSYFVLPAGPFECSE